MQLDDLKTIWQREGRAPLVTLGIPTSIRREVAKLDLKVRLGNFLIISTLWLIAALQATVGRLLSYDADALILAGNLASLIAAAIATIAMVRARRVTQVDDWTLRARLEIEIEKIEKQRKLMSRVAYWYLLPTFVGVGLNSLGGYHLRTGSYVPNSTLWLYYLFCAMLWGVTYWLMRYGSQRKHFPLLTQLRDLHADLVETAANTENKGNPQ